MAVKKTQLYASLWASCDKLRGGMDSSEYKDYILTLLFMKYVTDKFKNKGAYEDIKVFDKAHDKDPDPEKRTGCSFDDFIALKGKKNIGEGMDKIIARLADENTDLKGVIDIAHFNDEKKLGSGKEMVDKLTDLISIFQRPELDFSRNKAEGDDIFDAQIRYRKWKEQGTILHTCRGFQNPRQCSGNQPLHGHQRHGMRSGMWKW